MAIDMANQERYRKESPTMYSLVASAWPLPERTLADDRDAANLRAFREARIAARGAVDNTRLGDQGLLARIRRATGLDPAPSDCVCPA